MLLIISIIPMKLSVGKGELVLFAPNVIGFPWLRKIRSKNMSVHCDPFGIDNPLNQYNLDHNIRLKSNYNTTSLSSFPNYLEKFLDITLKNQSLCALSFCTLLTFPKSSYMDQKPYSFFTVFTGVVWYWITFCFNVYHHSHNSKVPFFCFDLQPSQ